jgi:alpha-glucosidase
MLGAGWNAYRVHELAEKALLRAHALGSSNTWVLSNHDIIRHATRFGVDGNFDAGKWFKANRFNPKVNVKQGLERATAMTMLLLALPGSTYLYQGEELGLQENMEIPDELMQDPQFFRNPDLGLSRDGCRVPLPWVANHPWFGFGEGGSHLPQPEWYKNYAVDVQDGNPSSTLTLYRRAIQLRKSLQTVEELTWIKHWFSKTILHFARPNGWHSITNFGAKPIKLPKGRVLLSNLPLVDGKLPANGTAWVQA